MREQETDGAEHTESDSEFEEILERHWVHDLTRIEQAGFTLIVIGSLYFLFSGFPAAEGRTMVLASYALWSGLCTCFFIFAKIGVHNRRMMGN